jgi:ribosomal protein L37E
LSDLCEKCLVLRPRRLNGIQIQNNITCNVCGHANYARQTVSCSISRKTFLRSDLKNSFSQKKKWFHPDERCDFLILNVFFHAFAPFGHMNRIAYEVESIWKIAMTNALPFINALYERNCCTLNDLIYEFNNKGQENDSSSIWTLLPVPVSRKLHQFLRILQEEMINLVPTNKQ